MYKKPIIVFEGVEGSGKSLHINNVATYLKKNGDISVDTISGLLTDYANNSNADAANSIDISGDGASTTRYISFLLVPCLNCFSIIFLPIKFSDYFKETNIFKPTSKGVSSGEISCPQCK